MALKPLQEKLVEVLCREIAEWSVKYAFEAAQKYVERTIEKGREIEHYENLSMPKHIVDSSCVYLHVR